MYNIHPSGLHANKGHLMVIAVSYLAVSPKVCLERAYQAVCESFLIMITTKFQLLLPQLIVMAKRDVCIVLGCRSCRACT